MTMRELAAQARLIAQSIGDHPWGKGVSERDKRVIDRTVKSLELLVGEVVGIEKDLCKRMAELEAQNARLKRESWEDGERIQQLQKELSDLKISR